MSSKSKNVDGIAVEFGQKDLRLAGRLYLPDSAHAVPGAVLCHGLGSGQSTMESSARAIVARGVAALTFDFRGHGQSQGIFDGSGAEDAVEAWRFLGQTERVDRANMAIVGHSTGARSAILAATQVGSLSTLVLLSCLPDPDMQPDPDPANRARFWQGSELPVKEYPRDGRLPWVHGAHGVLAWAWMHLRHYKLRIDWQKYFESLATIKTSAALPRLGDYPKLFVYCRGDKYINQQHAMALYEQVSQPKELILQKDSFHAAPLTSPSLRRAWIEWLLAQLLP